MNLRKLWAVLFIMAGMMKFTAMPSRAAGPAPQNTSTNLLSSDPDKAWKQIEDDSKAPPLPAEWAGKVPTEEQKAAFYKQLGEASAKVAAEAKEFYTRFPQHAKADDAKARERRFTEQAAVYGHKDASKGSDAPKTEEEILQEKVNAVQQHAMLKRAEGLPAVLKEFEGGIRDLIKENPKHQELWGALFTVAQYGDKESAKRVLTDIINSKADDDLVSRAKGMLKSIGAVGQPLEISFTAADGRAVDIQKMKGKVVMVDFWASWCGPCMASLPEVIEMYHKYHDKGFDIVGINLDQTRRGLDSVLDKYNIPWPQYFDGKGWGNKFSLEYGVSAIPSVWLVDKKGVLRTMEGREELEKQIQGLLAEKE
jgi:thiol-disulfide isomerase/thioredoxin